MDAIAEKGDVQGQLAEPRARIGLIIPSVNRMTEPQFNHYAPDSLGIHVARGRVAGGPNRTVAELTDEIHMRQAHSPTQILISSCFTAPTHR